MIHILSYTCAEEPSRSPGTWPVVIGSYSGLPDPATLQRLLIWAQEVTLQKVRELCSRGGSFSVSPAPHVLSFHKASNPGEIPVRTATPTMVVHFQQVQGSKESLNFTLAEE